MSGSWDLIDWLYAAAASTNVVAGLLYLVRANRLQEARAKWWLANAGTGRWMCKRHSGAGLMQEAARE